MTLPTKALIVVLVSPFIGLGLILISGRDGVMLGQIPVFDLCIVGAFLCQWLAFIPSYLYQTEHYFDLSGSATYIAIATIALVFGALGDPRSILLAALIIVWATRLGGFLFSRVRKKGSDSRFKDILPNFRVNLLTWTLQAIWVSVTASCALVAITSANKVPIDGWAILGLILWCAGFTIEVLADRQKQVFRSKPENARRFITTGLWAWSRHPNYLGEIMLWTGIAIMALPVLVGWQFATLMSPFFVYYLLTRVSGIEMQERQNDKTWGADAEYWKYKDSTPALWPFIGVSGSGQSAR